MYTKIVIFLRSFACHPKMSWTFGMCNLTITHYQRKSPYISLFSIETFWKCGITKSALTPSNLPTTEPISLLTSAGGSWETSTLSVFFFCFDLSVAEPGVWEDWAHQRYTSPLKFGTDWRRAGLRYTSVGKSRMLIYSIPQQYFTYLWEGRLRREGGL